jgi:hypothetical protein
MFARIARLVVLSVALTMLGGNTVAAASGLAVHSGVTAPTKVAHMAGDEHCC